MSGRTPPTDDQRDPDLVDRFLELSTMWRLIGAAALVLIAVLVWDEYVRPTTESWNGESDRIARTIERARTVDRTTDPKIERLATALGPIEVPRSAAPGAGARGGGVQRAGVRRGGVRRGGVRRGGVQQSRVQQSRVRAIPVAGEPSDGRAGSGTRLP